MISTDLGAVTAYAYAVSKEYPGTEEQFAEDMAAIANEASKLNALYPADTTLAISGKAADAKTTGDKITESKNQIKKYNAYDIVREICTFQTTTHNGITFTYNASNHTYTVNGTASDNAFVNLFVNTSELPADLVPGKTYRISYESTSSDIYFTFVQYHSGGTVDQTNFREDTEYTLPTSLVGIIIRLLVPSGKSVSSAIVSEFSLANAESNEELKEDIEALKDIVFDTETSLFEIDPDTLFGLIYQDGTHTSASDLHGMTGYIPVVAGRYYLTPVSGVYCLWYTSNKSYLERTERPTADGYLAPANAAYGRFIIYIPDIDSFYVKEKGADYSSLIGDASIEEVTAYEDTYGVAFGTSLTERGKPGFSGGYTRYLQTMGNMCIMNNGNSSGVILADGTHPNILSTIRNYTNYSNKDFVIVEGFTNDWYYNGASLGSYTDTGETTVCGCVRAALTYIMQNAPSATLIFVLDTYGRNYDGIDGSSTAVRNNLTQYQFYEELAKVAESLSVPVIKLYAISGINEYTPDYLLDSIHPTLKGAEQTARAIWSVMKNIPLKAK